ncbi:MAG: EAL domain-containing protein [Burkholderiales bacterium]|nr:EAL domain-containing protein [Burkholderiales bacterium]
MPAFLDLRRLQGRIVALFLGLLLLVQAGGFMFVRQAIEARVEQQILDRLGSAEYQLRTELKNRAYLDGLRARIASEDKGFIDAVGMARDDDAGRDTLVDALNNQAERAQAQVAAYRSEDFFVGTSEAARQLADAADRLRNQDQSLQLAVGGDSIYQVSSTALKAPGLSGTVLMAWMVTDEALINLKRLSNVDALLAVRHADGRWGLPVSTLEPEQAAKLLLESAPGKLTWRGEALRTRTIALPAAGGTLDALLWASFDEELRPFLRLQRDLLLLTAAGVALFALGAVFTARRVARPIQQLARRAERLGAGDFDTPVHADSGVSEVRELRQAFETMREGIKSREAQVEKLAFWDALTGLPNRAQFVSRLRELLVGTKAGDSSLALLMLNLDRFKPVNDALGRELGDELLRQVALRLSEALPAKALLARLGGDEFAVALPHADAEAAMAQARALLARLETPLRLDDQLVDVGASVGLALAPEQAAEADDLISLAERAMDLAKKRLAGALLFEPEMDARSPASLGLLSELRHALENHELRLFLQPKLDLRGRRIRAAEALVRWQHPTRGMVPPGAFIPFAEQTGFIRQISAWVLQAAAACAAQAAAQGLSLRISVNLSTRDLLDVELPTKLQALVEASGCGAEGLCLEITESAIMDDPKRALETAKALHAAGFKLSIDDFGTGYSSLAYLKQLPVQELKIDQGFVFFMKENEGDRQIVRSIIELAHNLGLAVVAEGIENAETLELLAAWGCDEGQGYHIAKPMPAEALLVQLLSEQNPTQRP